MRKVLIAVAAFGLLAGAACGSDSKDEAKTPTSDNMGAAPAATIKASGTTWSPDEVSIKVGDTVEWDVDGSVVHDLKGDEGVVHALRHVHELLIPGGILLDLHRSRRAGSRPAASPSA